VLAVVCFGMIMRRAVIVMNRATAAGRGVAVIVQVFGFGGFAVLATVAFEQAAGLQLAPINLGVKQIEDALVKAKMRAEREGDLRVLLLQAFDLILDAFDQYSGNR